MVSGTMSAKNTGMLNSYVNVKYRSDVLPNDRPIAEQLYVLRRMFSGYDHIRIEHSLAGRFTSAILLIVTPFHVDGRQDAPVAVKIDKTENILDETTRYEQHVKHSLPPLTARIEDRPTAPDNSALAGVKYTLISEFNESPKDLRAIIAHWSAETIGNWLQD